MDASPQMRSTHTLDDDVLVAAKMLARPALAGPNQQLATAAEARRNGLPLLPQQPGGAPVDLELVNQLRDEAP